MALPGLVRATELARLLGVTPRTAIIWCRKLGIRIAKAPVRGTDDATPEGHRGKTSPIYVSISESVKLLEHMLPGVANFAERSRLKARIDRRAAQTARGSRNVRNEIMWED